MARLLSSTRLLLHRQTPKSPPLSVGSTTHFYLNNRHISTKHPQLIEIDLESSSSSDSESLATKLHKLEDIVHRIIIQKSAPSWLPFIPGSSYWVPPKPESHNFAQVLTNLANRKPDVSNVEEVSLTSHRGWPSSAYYIEGNDSMNLEHVEANNLKSGYVEVEVVRFNPERTSSSEAEEDTSCSELEEE